MSIDKSLISGSTSMLVMKLLEEQDMYGYQMIHGMESKGYLTSYEQEEGGKTRKYYGLTREGRKVLKEKKEEWKTYRYAVESVLKADGALAGNV